MLIELRNVTKRYETFTALKGIDLAIEAGEFIAIVGKSGSGKSTLLNIISGIDVPTTGEVLVNNTLVNRMSQDEMAVWRGKTVGVVFQFFQLLPTLTVIENVMLPMDFCNVHSAGRRKSQALALLDRFGIAEQADKLPAMLSGGQQQRAALARALANDPPILVADEPTGNLDSHNSDAVRNLFRDLAAAGKTVVMVTHEHQIASFVNRRVTLTDGVIDSHQADGKHDENTLV